MPKVVEGRVIAEIWSVAHLIRPATLSKVAVAVANAINVKGIVQCPTAKVNGFYP